MLYFFNAFLLINIHLWWNGQMLGSLTCHYITQQISMKNFLPRSLHRSKHYIQYGEVQITFNLYLGIGYLLSLSFSDVPTPFLHPLLTSFLDVLVHLAAGWHLYVCLGAFGSSLSVARSQIPDDTCEPWQSSWFTVVVSRLLCQTKHQYNVFSLTIPQQFPTPNDSSPLSPALNMTKALRAVICYCKHCQWISLFLTMSASFNYWWMSRMSTGSISFLSEPNPFLVLCNTVPHCLSALINILHMQHLWSVFHCSSSGETSVAALQMDIGASPETMRLPHTTSLACV